MKQLVFFLCLIFPFLSVAQCPTSYIHVWPSANLIKKNPIFMVEAYGQSMNMVYGLGDKFEATLHSDSHIVVLQVVEVLEGEVNVAQAILKPTEELHGGKIYSLKISGLKQYYNDPVIKIPGSNALLEPVWQVDTIADTEKPAWLRKPEQIGKVVKTEGCGPELFVKFDIATTESANWLVETTLTDTKTGRKFKYYLVPTAKNTVHVGRTMCFGAFNLQSMRDYELEFNLVDASDNRRNWNGKILFTAPKF